MQGAWINRYALGVPASINYPAWTVPDLLRHSANCFSNSPALLFYGTCISYGELDDLTTRFALALRQLGISRGSIRQFSKVPILVLSALNKPGAVAQALDEGADDYLIKPVPSGVLIAHLKNLIRRSRAEKQASTPRFGTL